MAINFEVNTEKTEQNLKQVESWFEKVKKSMLGVLSASKKIEQQTQKTASSEIQRNTNKQKALFLDQQLNKAMDNRIRATKEEISTARQVNNEYDKIQKKIKELTKVHERYQWLLKKAARSKDYEVYNKTKKQVDNLKLSLNRLKSVTGVNNDMRKIANSHLKEAQQRYKGLHNEMVKTTKAGGILNSMYGKMSIIMSGVAATIFVMQSVVRAIRAMLAPTIELGKAFATMRGELRLSEKGYKSLENAARSYADRSVHSYTDTSKALILLMNSGKTTKEAIDQMGTALALSRKEGIDLNQAVELMRGGFNGFIDDAKRLAEELDKTSGDSVQKLLSQLKKFSTYLVEDTALKSWIDNFSGFLKYLREDFGPDVVGVWNEIATNMKYSFFEAIGEINILFVHSLSKLKGFKSELFRTPHKGEKSFWLDMDGNPIDSSKSGITRNKMPELTLTEKLAKLNKKINEDRELALQIIYDQTEALRKQADIVNDISRNTGTGEVTTRTATKEEATSITNEIYRVFGVTTKRLSELKSIELETYLQKMTPAFKEAGIEYKKLMKIHKEFANEQAKLAPKMKALESVFAITGVMSPALRANIRKKIWQKVLEKIDMSTDQQNLLGHNLVLGADKKEIDTSLKILEEGYKATGLMSEKHYAMEIRKIANFYETMKGSIDDDELQKIIASMFDALDLKKDKVLINSWKDGFSKLKHVSKEFYDFQIEQIEKLRLKRGETDLANQIAAYDTLQWNIKALISIGNVSDAIGYAFQNAYYNIKRNAELAYQAVSGLLGSLKSAISSSLSEVLTKSKGGFHDYTGEINAAQGVSNELKTQLSYWEAKIRYFEELNALTGDYSLELQNAQDQVAKISAQYEEQQGVIEALNSKAEESYSGLFDAIGDLWDKLQTRMVDAFIGALADMAAEAAVSGILKIITGAADNSGGGFFSNLWDGITSIFRAEGGPAKAGQPYIIGEKGPELFIPTQTGEVISNRDTQTLLGGGIRGLAEGTILPFTALREAGTDLISGKGFFTDLITKNIINEIINEIINTEGGGYADYDTLHNAISKGVNNRIDYEKRSNPSFSLSKMAKDFSSKNALSQAMSLFTGDFSTEILGQLGMIGNFSKYGQVVGKVLGFLAGFSTWGTGSITGTLGGVIGDGLGDLLDAREMEGFRDFLEDKSGYISGRQEFRDYVEGWGLDLSTVGYGRKSQPNLDFLGSEGVGSDSNPSSSQGFGDFDEMAKGGPLGAGQLALVGERGPELFVPHSSGNIISNSNVRALAEGTVSIGDGWDREGLAAGAAVMLEMWKEFEYFKYFSEDVKDAIDIFSKIDWSDANISIGDLQKEFENAQSVMEEVSLFWQNAGDMLDLDVVAEHLKNSNTGQSFEERVSDLTIMWDALNKGIDEFITPLNQFEKEMRSITIQFDEWITKMIELGFSQKAIAEVEERRAEALQNVEIRRIEAINDLVVSAIGMAYDMGAVKDTTSGINEQFVNLIKNMIELGATAEQLGHMETLRYKAIENALKKLTAQVTGKFTNIIDDISFANSGMGSRADYVMGGITGITSGRSNFSYETLSGLADRLVEWYGLAIAERQQVFQEQQEASQLWDQVTDTIQRLLDSIRDLINSIKYSDLNVALPTMKAQEANQDYFQLRRAAYGGGVEEIEEFIGFAQTYLQTSQNAFKSSDRYQNIYAQTMSDLETFYKMLENGQFSDQIAAGLEKSKEGEPSIQDLSDTFMEMQKWIARQLEDTTAKAAEEAAESFAEQNEILMQQIEYLKTISEKEDITNVYIGNEQFDARIEKIAAEVATRLNLRNQTNRTVYTSGHSGGDNH